MFWFVTTDYIITSINSIINMLKVYQGFHIQPHQNHELIFDDKVLSVLQTSQDSHKTDWEISFCSGALNRDNLSANPEGGRP